MSIKPVETKTIVNQIIDNLTDSIARGEYKSGEKLPSEFELMEELQVSRNSLREAMKILAAMGIVEIRRGDGTYLCSQVNPSLFDRVIYSMIYDSSRSGELLELRQIMDETTLRMAISKITEEEVLRLQETVDQMNAAYREKNYSRMRECDMRFHQLLIESCKNVFFVRMMKGIYTIFENSISETLKQEVHNSKAPVHHQNILDCVVQGRYQDIHDVVQASLSTWKERL